MPAPPASKYTNNTGTLLDRKKKGLVFENLN